MIPWFASNFNTHPLDSILSLLITGLSTQRLFLYAFLLGYDRYIYNPQLTRCTYASSAFHIRYTYGTRIVITLPVYPPQVLINISLISAYMLLLLTANAYGVRSITTVPLCIMHICAPYKIRTKPYA